MYVFIIEMSQLYLTNDCILIVIYVYMYFKYFYLMFISKNKTQRATANEHYNILISCLVLLSVIKQYGSFG